MRATVGDLVSSRTARAGEDGICLSLSLPLLLSLSPSLPLSLSLSSSLTPWLSISISLPLSLPVTLYFRAGAVSLPLSILLYSHVSCVFRSVSLSLTLSLSLSFTPHSALSLIPHTCPRHPQPSPADPHARRNRRQRHRRALAAIEAKAHVLGFRGALPRRPIEDGRLDCWCARQREGFCAGPSGLSVTRGPVSPCKVTPVILQGVVAPESKADGGRGEGPGVRKRE